MSIVLPAPDASKARHTAILLQRRYDNCLGQLLYPLTKHSFFYAVAIYTSARPVPRAEPSRLITQDASTS